MPRYSDKEQRFIDEIEDYVAGNIEGQLDIDRMSFSRFLRRKYHEVASMRRAGKGEK